MLRRFLVCAALTALAVGPAVTATAAQHESKEKTALANVKRLGGTGPWSAYVDDAPGGKICYLIGKPKKVGGHAKADTVRMSVTHRPADKVSNVVNFMLGFHPKKGSDATLDVDGRKFDLFTEKDGAWTRDAATDRAVVTAMKDGARATIKAQPEHGGAVSDSYDLSGFTATLTLIDKACGIRR